jgi:hypothetical protein
MLTLRDLDGLFRRRVRERRRERDDWARLAWYVGLFVVMSNGERYPESPEEWTASELERRAEERRKYNDSWTVKDVFEELGDG